MPEKPSAVYDAVMSRKSVREFTGAPVEDEKIERCLEAARWAPSYRNLQCWHFIVVTGKDRIEELDLLEPQFKNVPVLLVACGDPEKSGSGGGKPYYLVDVSIALEHIVLTAQGMGIGTCWVAGFDEDAVRNTFGIPENIRVVALLPIGYPAEGESAEVRELKERVGSDERKEIVEFVHYGKW
jgi:nitroreductase